ncbi:MAG: FG-GAP repeat domain-containing protein, partial [Candidatus Angelobacter sp.]
MKVSRMSSLVFLLSFLVSISHAQLTFDHTSAPGSMTILADLNDDGLPDAIAAPAQDLVVQLNGGGHFLAPVSYPMRNQGVSGIVVNDFNGDGLSDVLVATSSDFEFFPGLSDPNGNPNGMLKTPGLTVTAPHRNYIFVASMDVNHDGKPDLIAIDTFRVALKLGNGDGTFQGATTLYDSSVAGGFGMNLAAIGNFDGDSNGDIAVYEEQLQADGETTIPRLTVLYGNGQGAFTPIHTLLNT